MSGQKPKSKSFCQNLEHEAERSGMVKPVPKMVLREGVRQALILAYKEDTQLLESALKEEGFSVTVLRAVYSEDEMKYSRTIRCLLNHCNGWQRASKEEGYSLIVEADFVPCRHFGELPVPFDPMLHGPDAWAFLYAGGPRVFKRHPDGALQGHASCPVAYLISPAVAQKLCQYADDELKRQGDLTTYSLWDTQFQWHLMGMGAVCFMPYRQYGEHGGISNPEHAKSNVGFAKRLALLGKLGLGNNHRAETLYGPLRFLPTYAKGSRLLFWTIRLEAKITGLFRLISGRVVAEHGQRSTFQSIHLYWIGFVRLCTLW